MRFELHQSLRAELSLRLIPEFTPVIAYASPFRAGVVRSKAISSYLNSVALRLSRKEISPEMAADTAVALGIAIYADPIMKLGVSERALDDLAIFLKQAPYDLSSPFELHYAPAHAVEDSAHQLPLLDTRSLVGVDGLAKRSFVQPDRLQRDLVKRTARLGDALDKFAFQTGHYMYQGLAQVCLPLFCENPILDQHLARIDRLALSSGVFAQEFPQVLARYLPEYIERMQRSA